MRARLREHDQAVLKECAALLTDFEEETLQLGDFQEFFDVLGVLPEVLQQAGSCEAFVAAARGGE
eukprot:1843728-Prymnesium_polylepis.1